MLRDEFISNFLDSGCDFFGVRLTFRFVVVVAVSAAAASVVVKLIVFPVLMVIGPVLVAISLIFWLWFVVVFVVFFGSRFRRW